MIIPCTTTESQDEADLNKVKIDSFSDKFDLQNNFFLFLFVQEFPLSQIESLFRVNKNIRKCFYSYFLTFKSIS